MTSFLTHPSLDSPRIAHGFFTRQGGVSTGIYKSLNCGPGSNDDPENVRTNRHRVIAAIGSGELVTLHQVHSADVVIYAQDTTPYHLPLEGGGRREATGGGDATPSTTAAHPLPNTPPSRGREDPPARPKADALVTNQRGLLLGILTADCAPVLFADVDARVVGAAHAGWKGAFSGVLENTVAAMEALGAERARITAVIGPCIAQPSYEVGEEFVQRLVEADAQNSAFFIPPPDGGGSKWHFDLPGYALARLRATGIATADCVHRDTCAEEENFFSYRRTTLRQEPDYGRQLSVITLK